MCVSIARTIVLGLFLNTNGSRWFTHLPIIIQASSLAYHRSTNHPPKRHQIAFDSRTVLVPLIRHFSSSSSFLDRSITGGIRSFSTMNDDDGDDNHMDTEVMIPPPPPPVLRMLALHGSGGTGESLLKTLQHWNTNMNCDLRPKPQQQQRESTQNENVDTTHPDAVITKNNDTADELLLLLDITTVSGHVPKEDGFAWWALPPGERSFTANQYHGFEQSQSIVLDALVLPSPQPQPSSSSSSSKKEKPYDIILGHSQGAILLTALLALNVITEHPTIGYILNGVAWPNPYSLELESVQLVSMNNKKHTPIRILVLIGEQDQINPPAQADRVVAALQKAGCDVTVVVHPNGHAIPIGYDCNDNHNHHHDSESSSTVTKETKGTWESIRQWMSMVST